MYENAEMVPLKSDLESDIPPIANPHMSAEWCLIAHVITFVGVPETFLHYVSSDRHPPSLS